MRLNSVSSIGVLPFIEGSLGDGTSGLVASSRVDRMMKSTLRASLLKVATRTAVDLRHLAAVALWVLMNINESWHDDAPTSPFVNKEKRCAFKRPSYTGIPVLVSCIVLKGPLKCCLRAVSQLGGISSHFRTEFGFLQFVCVFLPLSS